MFLENKQKITEIDLGWKNADYVSPVVSSENDDMDKDPAELKFAWFRVESNIASTDNEEKEKMDAMREQFHLKIINKYGMPYGMEMPKEFKAIIKEREQKEKKSGKWDRQRKRMIDREIEKDMKSERRNENINRLIVSDSKSTPSLDKLIISSFNTDTY